MPPVIMGFDAARFGDDSSVLIVGKPNGIILEAFVWSGADTMKSTGRIMDIAKSYGESFINVDEIGLGGGILDRLKELGYPCRGVNVGSSPIEKDRFVLLRDEIFWNLRERFKNGMVDLTRLSQDFYYRLCGELVAMDFIYTSDGRIKLEPKADTKKRLGHSPDAADALALLFATNMSAGYSNILVKTQTSRWANDLATRQGSRWKR